MALFEVSGLDPFFRRPAGGHRFQPDPGGRGTDGAHRTQRRREDHDLQPGLRRLSALRRNDPVERQNLVGLHPHQVTACGVARTFQNIRLWPDLTVLDNLRVGNHFHLGYGLWDILLQTSRFRSGEEENTHPPGNC